MPGEKETATFDPPEAQPALCDTCREPGHCCKAIPLHNVAWLPPEKRQYTPTWLHAACLMLDLKLPFYPDVRMAEPEPLHLGWLFKCVNLSDAGRCMDYENRPALCRDFVAGSDPLCVEHHACPPMRDLLKEIQDGE